MAFGAKIRLKLDDGSIVWINPQQILKMVKDTQGQYYIVLVNGEKYYISHGIASDIENYFE
ncbi:MAG: FecR family protein [Acholeplasmatales bacterium]|nr:FecR family protein [Acholeplasmatales bacterium]